MTGKSAWSQLKTLKWIVMTGNYSKKCLTHKGLKNSCWTKFNDDDDHDHDGNQFDVTHVYNYKCYWRFLWHLVIHDDIL